MDGRCESQNPKTCKTDEKKIYKEFKILPDNQNEYVVMTHTVNPYDDGYTWRITADIHAEKKDIIMLQKVLVSIDTEGPAGADPVEHMIFGKATDGKEYGIRYLMQLFSERQITGLFFVDIPEMADHGEKMIARVMKEIDDSGHDIGVHVHPDHMADINRRYLWQYTKEEQYEIIARCTDFYAKVLKKPPLSFRAGRYGADNNTLQVLDELGYKYDMSEFHSSRYCKITPEITWNRVVTCGKNGLKEVPVTTFRSLSTPFYSRNDQIDSGNMPSEFKRNIRAIISEGSVDVISMFFHSFQFLNWRKEPDSPKFSEKRWKKSIGNLDYLLKQDVVFIAEKDLAFLETNRKDSVGALDRSKGLMPYYYFGLRAVETIWQRLTLNV